MLFAGAGTVAEGRACFQLETSDSTGGSFEDCAGFESTRPVFDGTLAELTDAGWLPLGPVLNTGDARTFRLRIEVQDRTEALGQTARAEFVWEATP